ncbi:MAG TPA: AIM24 family protein [Acidimicrobiales bacterium]|jgi:uncharacterized protein (AIM24 family)|nr:AIM24 family protein [Acidimicrobiales bacterium]
MTMPPPGSPQSDLPPDQQGRGGSYTCPYCRQSSGEIDQTCPHCGAPVDIREHVSDSGWVEQPPIRDMARLHFSRSTCQISGKFVPVADFGLHEDDWLYFSHHVLLHAAPTVRMENHNLPGGNWNRMLAGMPLVMMRAAGPGHIAFSHDDPGEAIAIPLMPGQAIDVHEHRFLVATGNVVYNWFPSNIWFTTGQGDDRETHYPMGMALDRFQPQETPGLLLLHSPGNVFIRDLQPGQTILIQPSALVYKDHTVQMRLHFEYPGGAYWFGNRWGVKQVWVSLYGPGRVAIQSVFERPEMTGFVYSDSGATAQRW